MNTERPRSNTAFPCWLIPLRKGLETRPAPSPKLVIFPRSPGNRDAAARPRLRCHGNAATAPPGTCWAAQLFKPRRSTGRPGPNLESPLQQRKPSPRHGTVATCCSVPCPPRGRLTSGRLLTSLGEPSSGRGPGGPTVRAETRGGRESPPQTPSPGRCRGEGLSRPAPRERPPRPWPGSGLWSAAPRRSARVPVRIGSGSAPLSNIHERAGSPPIPCNAEFVELEGKLRGEECGNELDNINTGSSHDFSSHPRPPTHTRTHAASFLNISVYNLNYDILFLLQLLTLWDISIFNYYE